MQWFDSCSFVETLWHSYDHAVLPRVPLQRGDSGDGAAIARGAGVGQALRRAAASDAERYWGSRAAPVALKPSTSRGTCQHDAFMWPSLFFWRLCNNKQEPPCYVCSSVLPIPGTTSPVVFTPPDTSACVWKVMGSSDQACQDSEYSCTAACQQQEKTQLLCFTVKLILLLKKNRHIKCFFLVL